MIRFLMTSLAIVWARLMQMIALTGGDHRHGDVLGGCPICDRTAREVAAADEALQRVRQ